MQTNLPGIYAAGDCTETWHRLLERYVYLPLGTTSHTQGRVGGENTVGCQRLFKGTLGTQILGHWGSEISKRVDIFATALALGMTVEELNDLDLSYTPPLSSPCDPVQMSTQAWSQ